jgi:hypothetical protein
MSAHPSHWAHRPEARAAVAAKISAKLRGTVQSPETRAKRAASLRLNPPEADVQAMIRLYAALPMEAVAERVGYDRRLVCRVLKQSGVVIRPAGFQPGNTLGRAHRGIPKGAPHG